jgi:hypothetical protein
LSPAFSLTGEGPCRRPFDDGGTSREEALRVRRIGARAAVE